MVRCGVNGVWGPCYVCTGLWCVGVLLGMVYCAVVDAGCWCGVSVCRCCVEVLCGSIEEMIKDVL